VDTSLVRTAVTTSLAQCAGRNARDIRDGDKLVDDLGVDSMLAVRLLTSIEEGLGALLPEGCEGTLVGIETVGELVVRLNMLFADGGRAPTQ
jgi:acyl carrier protein